MRRVAQALAVVLLLGMLGCRATLALRRDAPVELARILPNAGEVAAGLYRSGQPPLEDATFEQLRKAGIRRILSFRWEPEVIEQERALAEAQGIAFSSIPWSGFDEPAPAVVDAFLKWTEGKKPALYHCRHGQERTGVLTGCYRIAKQRWPVDQAYEEMLAYHFRWFWYGHLTRFLYEVAREQGQDVTYQPTPMDLMRTDLLFGIYQMRYLVVPEPASLALGAASSASPPADVAMPVGVRERAAARRGLRSVRSAAA